MLGTRDHDQAVFDPPFASLIHASPLHRLRPRRVNDEFIHRMPFVRNSTRKEEKIKIKAGRGSRFPDDPDIVPAGGRHEDDHQHCNRSGHRRSRRGPVLGPISTPSSPDPEPASIRDSEASMRGDFYLYASTESLIRRRTNTVETKEMSSESSRRPGLDIRFLCRAARPRRDLGDRRRRNSSIVVGSDLTEPDVDHHSRKK